MDTTQRPNGKVKKDQRGCKPRCMCPDDDGSAPTPTSPNMKGRERKSTTALH